MHLDAPVKMPAMPSGMAPPLALLSTSSMTCLLAGTTPIQDIMCRTMGSASSSDAPKAYVLSGMPLSTQLATVMQIAVNAYTHVEGLVTRQRNHMLGQDLCLWYCPPDGNMI